MQRWFGEHRDRLVKRPKGRIVYAVRDATWVNFAGLPSNLGQPGVLLEKMDWPNSNRWTTVTYSDASRMVDCGPAPLTVAEVERRLRDSDPRAHVTGTITIGRGGRRSRREVASFGMGER
jgi:hypothetical protein